MIMTTIAGVAAWAFVPASPVRTAGRIDLRAAVLLSAWLVCLLLAISQGSTWGWTSGRVLGLLAGAAVTVALWVRTEVRSDEPLIDMRMMRLPAVWTTNVVSLLFGVGMYSLFAFLPQFLQTPESAGYGFGATVTESGLLMLPQSVATFVAGLLSGRLAARHGSKRVLIAGTGLYAACLLSLTLLHEQLWMVLVTTLLMGLAFGLAFAAMSNLVVESVPMSQTGVASGMNANIRTVGGAIGGAVLASVVTAGARADGLPVEAGYTTASGCWPAPRSRRRCSPCSSRARSGPSRSRLVGEVRHPELAVVAGRHARQRHDAPLTCRPPSGRCGATPRPTAPASWPRPPRCSTSGARRPGSRTSRAVRASAWAPSTATSPTGRRCSRRCWTTCCRSTPTLADRVPGRTGRHRAGGLPDRGRRGAGHAAGCRAAAVERRRRRTRREALHDRMRALLVDAQRAGTCRADATVDDLTGVLVALRGVREAALTKTGLDWRRHLELCLAGLRTRLSGPRSAGQRSQRHPGQLAGRLARPRALCGVELSSPNTACARTRATSRVSAGSRSHSTSHHSST